MTTVEQLIFDWNVETHEKRPTYDSSRLHDETLRDGLQSPSPVFKVPKLEEKMRMLECAEALGIASSDLGFPSSGAIAFSDVRAMVSLIREKGLKIEPTVAGRTHPADVEAAIKVFSESTGGVAAGCEMMAFLGSSQIRCLIEDWSVRLLESRVRETLRRLHAAGVRAAFVTEDTTRSSPELLSVLFRAAIEEGASALVLCDTVGHATPAGTRRLVEWTRILVDDCGAAGRVRIDFHGHNDRGLGVANALEALAAGADRAHGTIMGIGERVGNSALDSLLVNLALQNEITAESFGSKLRRLPEYVNLVSESTNTPLPPSYPAFGSDAFCTATGVHAAAIIKALAFGSRQLSDLVYSSVPASALGLEQVIRIGPQSGESNVVHWARRTPACGIRPGTEKWPPFASSVLRTAQEKKALLEESELLEIATRFR